MDSLRREPIQFIIKGDYQTIINQSYLLLNMDEMFKLNADYNYGRDCGLISRPTLVQKHITKPLLLDLENKFEFRIYMLIASINPLIVYYHDGYITASPEPFDRYYSNEVIPFNILSLKVS